MIHWPATELDPTSFPAWRETIARYEAGAPPDEAPRSYPGYPRWPLPRPRRRWRSSLDRSLSARRTTHALGEALPGAAQLGRILALSHGITGAAGRGPVPSAGGLQALELYVAVLVAGWLPRGVYHYDRAAHALAGVADPLDVAVVPALITVEGGAMLWVIVGDGARVAPKYGQRGLRFLLLEAGHLMQNLCVVCADAGLVTLPLGGYYERALASALRLPSTDEVLYVGVCGGRRGA